MKRRIREELTSYQKSIIRGMAENDYDCGHPMSDTDALEWFQSGEEEDIPTELASEAADYYFEAFDQVREDDNSDWDEDLDESKKFKISKKFLNEDNRIGNNEFVPDPIDQFLKDVAQFSNLFNYKDISAFEKDVFAPNDKNVKALRKLNTRAKSAARYDDEEELNSIYQDVADIVIGVVDYEQ